MFIIITITTTDQLRISTSAGGVHDTAIIATCVKGTAWNELEWGAVTQVAIIAASCTPPAPVLIWAGRWCWWLGLHVVAASRSDLCWCRPWPLHLAPWPLHLVLAVVVTGSNFSNLRWWCFSFSCWHKYSTCTRGGFIYCNLCQWCFSFHPLVIPYLH